VRGFVTRIGSLSSDTLPSDLNSDFGRYQFYGMSDEIVEDYLIGLKKEGDSVGGQIKIIIDHCPSGLGEPVFDKLKADFGKALMSIGGCVSFSYGIGADLSSMRGSEVAKISSVYSGIEGGISNGDRIILTASFKPTSTIGEKALTGRHDPCIVPRAVPVAEAMIKVVLADHYLRQNSYKN
jgi:chorismate synthase